MKKNILIIISILFLIYSIFNFRYISPKEISQLTLTGTKINEYLYAYPIDSQLTINNNNIYYLSSSNELSKQNIYTSKTYLNTLNQEDTCQLSLNYILCHNSSNFTLYDYNLNKLYSTAYNENIHIIPYKDTYLKYIDNTLLITLNNQETTFKTLNNDYLLLDYYYTNDNTYLLLNNTNTYYIYNLNNNTYEEIPYSNYHKYENGFYFYNYDTFLLYNLTNLETKEFKNFLNTTNFSLTSLKDNILYIYHNSLIQIIDLDNQTIKTLTLNIEDINNLIIQEDYLYLVSSSNLYLLDINNLNLVEENITTYLENQTNIINNKIQTIKENYNINIKIKNDTNLEYPDFTSLIETNNLVIINALDKITTILSKYNQDFFNTFYTSNYQGLNIYLTSTLTPKDLDTQAQNPAAYSLLYDDEYMIVLDINQSNIEELFSHELFHNIETNLKLQNIEPFINWNNLNPTEFNYENSYTSNNSDSYTLIETENSNVYFVDTYSKSYAKEDRARIFEIISTNYLDIKKYPNLYIKALYLKEELLTYYPNLQDTTLFKNLTD